MWLKNLQCPKTYQQIQADLSIHKEIDLGIVAKEAVKRFSDAGRHSLCHYKIIDNKVGYFMPQLPVIVAPDNYDDNMVL